MTLVRTMTMEKSETKVGERRASGAVADWWCHPMVSVV
jgi:hypothetical protein